MSNTEPTTSGTGTQRERRRRRASDDWYGIVGGRSQFSDVFRDEGTLTHGQRSSRLPSGSQGEIQNPARQKDQSLTVHEPTSHCDESMGLPIKNNPLLVTYASPNWSKLNKLDVTADEADH